MGQKVNPHGLRVGVINGWETQWYAGKKDFGKLLKEDYDIRTFIKKKYYDSGISRITIHRLAGNQLVVTVHAGRPGTLIGNKGTGAEQAKAEVKKLLKGKELSLNIVEVKRIDLDAQLVAESIAAQLEKRASFRRTMKQAMQRTMKAGAKGVKIMVAGRLDGAEIARTEHYHEGSIPLQTLRADIDYGFAGALTGFGMIGVKVWLYKGEILKKAITPKGGDTTHVDA
ncbi:MAG: 30S ribosomal protein S3 [Clostridiales bacterium]|jgi:small subunit ribosomal protein S3|nr:30S ribosomal protein S3 [Clostridiales bacterium]